MKMMNSCEITLTMSGVDDLIKVIKDNPNVPFYQSDLIIKVNGSDLVAVLSDNYKRRKLLENRQKKIEKIRSKIC